MLGSPPTHHKHVWWAINICDLLEVLGSIPHCSTYLICRKLQFWKTASLKILTFNGVDAFFSACWTITCLVLIVHIILTDSPSYTSHYLHFVYCITKKACTRGVNKLWHNLIQVTHACHLSSTLIHQNK